MIKTFIDSDIILDLLQERKPFFKDALTLFALIEKGKIHGYVSPLIFSNLYYILRKFRNAKFAVSSLLRLKLLVKILPVNEKIIDLALSSDFKDFEDAIQYYCALENNIPHFITRNKRDYRETDLVICNPKEFLKIIELNKK
jgi:predicted nucleic acid-binding protein